MLFGMRALMIVVLGIACNSNRGVATKPALVGTLQISGAVTGTFTWTPELGITCSWRDSPPLGAFDVTMANGSGTAITLRGIWSQDKKELTLTAGMLGGATLHAEAGFSMAGSAQDKRIAADIDAAAMDKDHTVSMRGKLRFSCP
jgi:hypothetical protein